MYTYICIYTNTSRNVSFVFYINIYIYIWVLCRHTKIETWALADCLSMQEQLENEMDVKENEVVSVKNPVKIKSNDVEYHQTV